MPVSILVPLPPKRGYCPTVVWHAVSSSKLLVPDLLTQDHIGGFPDSSRPGKDRRRFATRRLEALFATKHLSSLGTAFDIGQLLVVFAEGT